MAAQMRYAETGYDAHDLVGLAMLRTQLDARTPGRRSAFGLRRSQGRAQFKKVSTMQFPSLGSSDPL